MNEIVFANGTKATPTNLQDCFALQPRVFGDHRGYFNPLFLQEYMDQLGFERVVQINRSLSSKGSLRGLHFQKGDTAQAKIVEVVSGAAVDVVVDIRKGSPTYLQSTAVLLTPYNPEIPGSGNQLFVPRGFAHGFLALKDNTVFQYFIDNHYNVKTEGGILYNDPAINPGWEEILETHKIRESELVFSEKDLLHPAYNEENNDFVYVRRR